LERRLLPNHSDADEIEDPESHPVPHPVADRFKYPHANALKKPVADPFKKSNPDGVRYEFSLANRFEDSNCDPFSRFQGKSRAHHEQGIQIIRNYPSDRQIC
jgi:hypothetical protein